MLNLSPRHLLGTLFVQLALATQAHAAELQSAARLTFGDAGTLFIADWKAARIYAIRVPALTGAEIAPFNLADVQKPIAAALKVAASSIRFEDLAVQPGGGIAYVALTVAGAKPRGAVVSIDSHGTVRRVPTANLKTWAAIGDAPSKDATFWRTLPAQALTVTDMKFHDQKLYVAGLSSRGFASTLRVFDYPFKQRASAATVEMYHPVHDEVETRAPIRAMAIVTAGGVPSMVAAYTCTPLVIIPLADIRDGAHIVGKTIGEMGWGSAPVGMVNYKMGDVDYVLLANSSRSADLMAVTDIAAAAAQPGIGTPIEWPAKPYSGVSATMTPLAAVMRIDNLNDKLLLALRRDAASGDMQLVSIPKGVYLRLSDFVNEYDFKDYVYPAADKFREFHKYGRSIEGYPELAR
jgi:hypothetical protein